MIKAKLKEVCSFDPPKSEARESLKSDDLVGFMPMKDLGIESKNAKASSSRPLNEVIKAYTYFAEKDVLVAKITPCFENGKMGIARDLENKIGFGSSEYFVLRPGASVMSEYIYYFLRQEFVINNGKEIMTGAVGHKRIPSDYLENLEIPLPTLEKQREIVEKLDSAFAEIDLLEKNLELSDKMLEQLFQSILSTAFKQSQTFSEQSESSVKEISAVKLMKLVDICKLVGGGTPSKANSEYYSGEILWATVRDMRSRWLEDTEHKINEIAVRESSTNVIPAGNVVLASRVGLGKVIQLKQDTAINQDLRALIPKENSKIDSGYLYYWTLSITPEIIAAGKGATVQGVTLPFLENLVVPLPSLETQSEIVEKLDSAFAEIETLKAQIKIEKDYIVALRQSFLSNAFSLDEAVA